MTKTRRKKWKPSEESQAVMGALYSRLQNHQLMEGDFYFLFSIAKEALDDWRLGPKIDRALRQAIVDRKEEGDNA